MAEATVPDEIDKVKKPILTDGGVDVKKLEGQLIGAESEKSIDEGVILDGGADGKDSGIKFGVESPTESVNQNRKKKKNKNKKKRNNGNAGQLSARSSDTHEDSPNIASAGSIVAEHEGSSHNVDNSVPEICEIVTELESVKELETSKEEPVTVSVVDESVLPQELESVTDESETPKEEPTTEESGTPKEEPVTTNEVEEPKVVFEEPQETPVESGIELTDEASGLNATGSNAELGITNQPSLNVIFYSDGSGHVPSQGDLTHRLTASETALKQELDAALESEFPPEQTPATNDVKEATQPSQDHLSEEIIIPEDFPDPDTQDEEVTSPEVQGPILNILKPSFVEGSSTSDLVNLAQIDEELLEPDDILNNNYIRSADSQDFENKWNNDFYLSSESKDALRIPAVPNPSLVNIEKSTAASTEDLSKVPVPPPHNFGNTVSDFMSDRAGWKENSPEFVSAAKKSLDGVLEIASSQIEVVLARVDDFIMGGAPCDDLSETIKTLGIEEEENPATEAEADTGSMNNLLRFDEESDISIYPVNFSKLAPDEPGYLSVNGTTFKLEEAVEVVPQISEGFQVTEKSPFELEENNLENDVGNVKSIPAEIFETKSDPDVPPPILHLAETNPFRSDQIPTVDPNIIGVAALFPSPPSDRDFFWEESYKYQSSFEQDYLKLTAGNFQLNYEPASGPEPEHEETNIFQSAEVKVGTRTVDHTSAHGSEESLVENWKEIPISDPSDETIQPETATNPMPTQKFAEPVLVRKGTPLRPFVEAAEIPSVSYELLKEDYDKPKGDSQPKKTKWFDLKRILPCITAAEGLGPPNPPPTFGPEREKRTLVGTIRNIRTGSLKRIQNLSRRN